jgi:hypothetical protein
MRRSETISTPATSRRGEPSVTPADLSITTTTTPGPSAIVAWDELVTAGGGCTDVSQLSHWAAIRAHAGYQPLYVFASRGSQILGGAIVLRRTVRGLGRIGCLPIDQSAPRTPPTPIRTPARHWSTS